MELIQEQVDDLKRAFLNLTTFVDGGLPYILIEKLQMPPGCQPECLDALLCPFPRDGYPSRLFLSAQVESPGAKNWNPKTGVLIGDRMWFAVSWKVDENLKLLQMVAAHLRAFRCAA